MIVRVGHSLPAAVTHDILTLAALIIANIETLLSATRSSCLWYASAQMEWKNKLYLGDDLEILREHVDTESVELIYIDPPLNSSATHNVLFREKSAERFAIRGGLSFGSGTEEACG